MDTQQIIILIAGVVMLGAFTFLPQWQNRRRRQKQIDELQIGDDVMTIGGIIGRLTDIDPEEHQARVEIAPQVEVRIALAGISHAITPPESPD